MIYVVGIIGFIGGFALGMKLIAHLLKDRPREDLLEDRGLRFSYGLLTWGIAGLSAFSAVSLFKMYFPVAG